MSTVFLDLDGTILDVSARYHAVHLATVRALGAESRLSREEYWAHKRRGLSNAKLLELEGLPVDPAAYGALFLDAIEAESALADDVPIAGALDALDLLRRDRRLVIVTLRRERDALLRSLAALGVAGRVESVLSASPLGRPGEESKAELIARHGTTTGADWIVGDTEIDVRAGKRLGLRTCAVISGIRNRDLLVAERPDRCVADLATFAAGLPTPAGERPAG